MKKVLGLLFASTLVFGIAGCGKKDDEDEKEKEKVVTFSEYLENSEGLTASKLNQAVGPISFEMDGYLTQLDIQKTKMTITDETNTPSDFYLWGGTEGTGEDAQKYVYGAMPGKEAGEYEVAKINLDTMDEFIDGMKEGVLSNSPIDIEAVLEDTDNSNTVEITEVIDNVITLGGLDTTTINVANILSKIDFDINDFEDKGNGVYKLKLSALFDIAADVTGEELPADINDQIAAMDEMLQIEVKYAENHINQVKLSVNVTEAEEGYSSVQNTIMTLGFEYSEDEVSKTTLGVVNTYVSTIGEGTEAETYKSYSAMSLVSSANELSLTFKTGETALDIESVAEFSRKVENAKTTLKLKVTTEGEVVGEVTLAVVGNWLSELDVTTGEMTISVESNTNVVIPAEVLEEERHDMTEDVLEYITNAMNPDDGSEDVA